MNNIDFYSEPAREWTITRATKDQHFAVTVRAWRLGENWVWNVYTTLFPEHPFYSYGHPPLSFHGGATYDQRIKYGDQESRKIDCDYNHYDDLRFNESDPREGIPVEIEWDVTNLIKELVGDVADEQRTTLLSMARAAAEIGRNME